MAQEAVQDSAEEIERRGRERRRHERVSFETTEQRDRRVAAENDRRKRDRRAIDAMRSEIKYTTAQGSRGDRFSRGVGLKKSRLLLLFLSIGAGGLAAYLATQNLSAPVASSPVIQTEIVQELRIPVLVAKQPIGIGEKLTPNKLEWQDWTEDTIIEDYITAEEAPDALAEYGDGVARFDIFPGEPIRANKVVLGADGYLSAVLAEGTRAVSISVTPNSASGGFVTPNDHVDVVLTRQIGSQHGTQTILQNVRVLAIGQSLGEFSDQDVAEGEESAQSRAFSEQAIATLALDPYQAETIIGATAMGELTLVLRSMNDIADNSRPIQSGLNQTIRLTSPFWNPQPVEQQRN